MRLSPYVRSGSSKRKDAPSLSVLDFIVSDEGRPLFHIEQKTGPGSIDDMSEFQLDLNDVNDIVGATNKTGLPTYIIHVWAGQEYLFPTRRTVIRGIWWTDVYRLGQYMKRIGNRRGEDKLAVFLEPSAFKPIATFPDELSKRRFEKLAARIAKKPIPLILPDGERRVIASDSTIDPGWFEAA